MFKQLKRVEVLKRVRFANRFYSPSCDEIYHDEMRNCNDLEIIRYDKKDWVEIANLSDCVHFITVEDHRKGMMGNRILIDGNDLRHLSGWNYGYLKGGK